MNPDSEDLSPRKLAPSEVDRLRRLAERVRQDLSASGLTVHATAEHDPLPYEGGGWIELDDLDDAGGGVWLHWRLHPRVREAIRAAFKHAQVDDPFLKVASQTYASTVTAVLATLAALGYEAERSRDDYRPHAVRVLAHPDIHA
ncbi:hypothetical protein [Streptomyces sp. NPDC101237]|uniref:hypothetical protein n=1 Tax=Streptomyces sp. NPDC101237 TaxID=3366139 RepID=UPI00382B754E